NKIIIVRHQLRDPRVFNLLTSFAVLKRFDAHDWRPALSKIERRQHLEVEPLYVDRYQRWLFLRKAFRKDLVESYHRNGDNLFDTLRSHSLVPFGLLFRERIQGSRAHNKEPGVGR